MDWQAIREQFPATREQTYLDTASYGPGPIPVRRAVEEAIATWSDGRGEWRVWEEAGETARKGFAAVLGVRPESIALLPAMSVGAGQVAEGMPAPPGANIVVGEEEFRSNLLPWTVQESRGFEVRLVPFREHGLALDDLAAAIDAKTALVAVSAVQSATGFRAPLEEIAELCAPHGARLFVDGTQAVGALRLPVEVIDYLAVAAYKWLLAPRGCAFLYVRPDRLDELRPFNANWKTPADPYADYYGPAPELADTARRFDVSLGWPAWVGAATSIPFVLDVGIESIERRDLALAARFREGLSEIGLAPLFPPERSSQIVSLRVPDPDATRRGLAEARVVASVRHGCLRTAFHFYNDESDVDRALEVLGGLGA